MENLTVHALETAKTYVIRFDAKGGTAQESITVTYGQAYELPQTTNEEYLSFDAWQYNGEKLDFAGIWNIDAEGEILLTAVWGPRKFSKNY